MSRWVPAGSIGLVAMATAVGGMMSSERSHAAAPGDFTPHACALRVDGIKLECGTLTVKADRAKPQDMTTIALQVVVMKSRSAKPAADPALFLTGGPGSSALYFLNILSRTALLDDRDIIAAEQRGNGYSEPNLLCDAEKATSAAELIASCHAQVIKRGVPVQAFNITQSAHDLADLRKALALPKWNVVGTSFGTFWGLHYARLYPGDIRSMVLDSPYPPQANPDESWKGHLNGISAVFAACRQSPECNRAYPDLQQRFVTLMETLAKTPRVLGKASFGAKDMMELVYNVNFETATARFVPRLIDAIISSDFATVEQIAKLDPYGVTRGFQKERAYSVGLNIGMPCIDDAAFASDGPDGLSLADDWPVAVIKAAQDGVQLKSSLCSLWPVTRADPIMNQPVTSDIPTIVTVGAFDPETPPALGQQMVATLSRGTLIIRPNAAHASLSIRDDCVDGLVNAFLRYPNAKPDTTCVAKEQTHFNLPGQTIALGGR